MIIKARKSLEANTVSNRSALPMEVHFWQVELKLSC